MSQRPHGALLYVASDLAREALSAPIAKTGGLREKCRFKIASTLPLAAKQAEEPLLENGARYSFSLKIRHFRNGAFPRFVTRDQKSPGSSPGAATQSPITR